METPTLKLPLNDDWILGNVEEWAKSINDSSSASNAFTLIDLFANAVIQARPKQQTIILRSDSWSSNQQVVSVQGVTTTNAVVVSPTGDSAEYVNSGIYCAEQAADSLTFVCKVAPTQDIDVNILIISEGNYGDI